MAKYGKLYVILKWFHTGLYFWYVLPSISISKPSGQPYTIYPRAINGFQIIINRLLIYKSIYFFIDWGRVCSQHTYVGGQTQNWSPPPHISMIFDIRNWEKPTNIIEAYAIGICFFCICWQIGFTSKKLFFFLLVSNSFGAKTKYKWMGWILKKQNLQVLL